MADILRLRNVLFALGSIPYVFAAENVMLTDVPDYAWHAGCFGTATGNLMGYWDRHGLPDMYTGPTAGGIAPLNSFGANSGIQSLWASQTGLDGRPPSKLGHIDDYWQYFDGATSFESTAPDPYFVAARPEHAPDCLGDFIGQSQRKFQDLDGECTGNIDGYAFNFWDKSGERRTNYQPAINGLPVRDIQSGLRAWSEYRGYAADVFSQLSDFNSTIPSGKGFTFEDLKAEINAGYPVLLFLQDFANYSRPLPGLDRANPSVHMMLAYGYIEDGDSRAVRYRTSWASGDFSFNSWDASKWEANLQMRGVISFRPQPRITKITRSGNRVQLEWHGPNSVLYDDLSGSSQSVHQYVIERADSLTNGAFVPITDPAVGLQGSVVEPSSERAFYRVRLATP